MNWLYLIGELITVAAIVFIWWLIVRLLGFLLSKLLLKLPPSTAMIFRLHRYFKGYRYSRNYQQYNVIYTNSIPVNIYSRMNSHYQIARHIFNFWRHICEKVNKFECSHYSSCEKYAIDYSPNMVYEIPNPQIKQSRYSIHIKSIIKMLATKCKQNHFGGFCLHLFISAS